jgi:predicted MFS family arabinose efflux permease
MIKKGIHIYKDAFSGLSRSVWLLSLIMFINRAGAMVLTFMSLYMIKDLGYSKADAGWVMGAYGLGSILGAYLGGQLTDRFGFYYVQLYSLLGSILFLILLIFVKDYNGILLIVFLFSTITDMLRPANSVAISQYSKPENLTRSFSLMRFAVNLGFSVGPAVGGFVAEYAGYKWVFGLDALTCFLAAGVLFFFLPYDPQYKPIKKEADAPKGLSAYKDRAYLQFIVLTAVWGILFFQLFSSTPVFWSQEFQYTESTIGQLLALNGLIIVLIEMPVIKYLEHITRYMHMVSLGSVMLVLSFGLLVVSTSHLSFAIGYIIFMSLAELFAMPFMTNYAVSRASEGRKGQYMALYAMAYGVAHIVAPLGSLQLAELWGFNVTYWICLVMSVAVAFVFFRLGRLPVGKSSG